jgi:hypothetical protein
VHNRIMMLGFFTLWLEIQFQVNPARVDLIRRRVGLGWVVARLSSWLQLGLGQVWVGFSGLRLNPYSRAVGLAGLG